MPIVTTDGADVYYEVSGEGPPLLMIAGIASDMASWGPLMPYLQTQFTLIRVDNRGAGRTKTNSISLQGMIADCVALLDHLEIDRLDLVGHSMGGMLALRIAAQHPARVNRLVNIAAGTTIGGRPQILIEDMVKLYDYGVPQKLWFRLFYQWLFARPFFEDPTNIEAAVNSAMGYEFIQSPELFKKQVEAVHTMQPLRGEAVNVPILSIAGSDDMMMPPSAIQKSFEGFSGVQFETIAGAGHSVHWDAAGPVAKAIKDFLGR